MKLTAFHATDGDCLLLEAKSGERVLIDGGRPRSFEENTRPVLDQLRDDNKAIDLVVVSHIDADHISGIVPLLDAVGQWIGFDHRLATAQPEERDALLELAPDVPKPPVIRGIWHNSWRNQLGELADPVSGLAQAVRTAVSLTAGDPAAAPIAAAVALSDLATSMEQGELLIDLIEAAGLPVAFNVPFGGMVMLRNPVHREQLGGGSMTLSVLGPAQEHLDSLREKWQEWVDGLEAEGAAGPGQPGGPGLADGPDLDNAIATAEARLEALTERAKEIAERAEVIVEADASVVTPPNRASIVLLAEEDDRTCLLTGDAAEPEILDGLRAANLLDGEPFRCNVLKVQHHGSEHNLSQTFAKSVLADDYVFSGDGASGNPNPDVVATIIETRKTAAPGKPYTLWFTTGPDKPRSQNKRNVMKAAIATAKDAAEDQPNLITVNVLDAAKPSFTIPV